MAKSDITNPNKADENKANKMTGDTKKSKNKKGKHIKEEVSNQKNKSKNKSKSITGKSNMLIKSISALIIAFVVICAIYLVVYFFKPEKANSIFSAKFVSEYDKYIRELSTNDNILQKENSSNSKYITKKYKDNIYYVATGFCEREYDIIYFNLQEDVHKKDKLYENTIMSYDKYVEYCKENNIKQKFTESSKRYSIFSDFSAGYDTIDVLVCDRQIDKDTEVTYLSKEYSGSNPGVTSGFVLIFPSSQINTTKTAMKEVISESDYCELTGEKINITNSPINKDVLFIKSKTITDDEKVNIVLNKMIENICHKNTIHYNYSYDIPVLKTIDAKLDLNSCTQVIKTEDGKKDVSQYTIYGDYEVVNFDEKGFISNSWIYKDQIIKKFIQAESLSNMDFFDFKLDEDDDYYIVKAFVSKQNYAIEGKVSREEEFFYIDKDTFELKKIYCHNYTSKYTIVFDYSSESIQLPENIF